MFNQENWMDEDCRQLATQYIYSLAFWNTVLKKEHEGQICLVRMHEYKLFQNLVAKMYEIKLKLQI